MMMIMMITIIVTPHQCCLIRDDNDHDDYDDKDEGCDDIYHRSILGITSAGY